MSDVQSIVNDFLNQLRKRKIEGSQARAKQTAEVLRSVISQQRMPETNQAGALIDSVRAVGEQLIAANPVEVAVGNIVRRVLHIIREEDLSLATDAIAGLGISAGSDDEVDVERDDYHVLSAAAAARSTSRPPLLQFLLEDMPDSAAGLRDSSSGAESKGKNRSAARSTSRPPSLQFLLEDVPDSAAGLRDSSSGAESEGKNRSATGSTSRPPSLQFLLEDVPDSAAGLRDSSSGAESEGKNRSATGSTSHPPSLQFLLEDVPDSAAGLRDSSSGAESEGKNRSAAATGSTSRPPSLQFLLEDVPDSAAGLRDSSSVVESEGKNRSAAAAAAGSTSRPPSLQFLLEDVPDSAAGACDSSPGGESEGKNRSADKVSLGRKLKHDVIEAVNDLIQDIATCHKQIAEQAVEHIHQNEVILTVGSSRTVLEFLCAAKEKKRSFRVFVVEGAPRYQGHLLAKDLAARGLQTTLITDSAVFAMISRVNMVIVGAHAVMANGGVIAPVGLNMVALAAKRHAVPFVVLAGSHKLCPLDPHISEVLLNDLRSPSELLDFGEFSDCMDSASGAGSLDVVNPTFDQVQPTLVSLFITDTGGHNPSFMHHLMTDYYSADDLVVKR
ncbi:hypothetical protein K1719_015561 [Acacia pycnantha]|nr:hypothetical protein K1719_015561 [Acacia pycnantha]